MIWLGSWIRVVKAKNGMGITVNENKLLTPDNTGAD